MALIADNFTRANQNGWGTASDGVTIWSRGNGSGGSDTSNLVTITSNKGRIASSGASYTPVAYTALSKQNNISIAVTINILSNLDSGTVVFICSKSGGNTNRDGVGLYILSGTTSNITLSDNGTTKATGSFTFTAGTRYNILLNIATSYAMDLYIWANGGSQPGSPTLSCGAFTPGASGTNIQFGNSSNGSNGSVEFDSLTVASLASSTGNFFMFFPN